MISNSGAWINKDYRFDDKFNIKHEPERIFCVVIIEPRLAASARNELSSLSSSETSETDSNVSYATILNNRLMCFLCGKIYDHKQSLYSHLDRKHPNESDHKKNYFCNRCSLSFNMKESLSRHVKSEHEVEERHCEAFTGETKRLICDLCSKSYETRSSMVRHLRFHRGLELTFNNSKVISPMKISKDNGINADKTGSYQCSYCDIVLNSLHTYQIHNDLKHGHNDGTSRKFQCNICPKSFAYRKNLNRHVHSNNVMRRQKSREQSLKRQDNISSGIKLHSVEQEQPETQQYKCSFCAIIYDHKKSLLYHLDVKHPNESDHKKNYYCNRCSLSFNMKGNLRRHVKSKHNSKRKLFNGDNHTTQPRKFSSEMKRNKTTAYHCKFCDKILNSLRTFKSHNDLKHGHQDATVRRHQCRICHKSFHFRENFRRHVRSHNVERLKRQKDILKKDWCRDWCRYCGIKLSSSYGVRRHVDFFHESMNHLTRRFNCSLCLSSFHYYVNLQRHSKICLEDSKQNSDQKSELLRRRSIRSLMKRDSEWKNDFELDE